ncbi:secreted RxLR effector protein 161-like [Apium graveolens]|uniref:secreted RxLR effector protein 161-like n=1 Tax=Apium graveolens TaxID=4045 RepID=UPI003D7BC1CD
MEHCNPVQNPIIPGCKLFQDENEVVVNVTYYRKLVGNMMYITTTRPDIVFVVHLLNKYMSRPTKLHLLVAKRVLSYLQGTSDFGLFYKKNGNNELIGYTDSDYAGDIEDRKSTSGYVFILSLAAVAWSSQKQPIVTLSTTKAEFVAVAACSTQAIWMKRILSTLGYQGDERTIIFCDNSSTIQLARNPVFHARSKHIEVRFHFLRDLENNGIVQLVHCGTNDQVVDVLTKPLKLETFRKMRERLGVCKVPVVN